MGVVLGFSVVVVGLGVSFCEFFGFVVWCFDDGFGYYGDGFFVDDFVVWWG